jgi:hypothetical protein
MLLSQSGQSDRVVILGLGTSSWLDPEVNCGSTGVRSAPPASFGLARCLCDALILNEKRESFARLLMMKRGRS